MDLYWGGVAATNCNNWLLANVPWRTAEQTDRQTPNLIVKGKRVAVCCWPLSVSFDPQLISWRKWVWKSIYRTGEDCWGIRVDKNTVRHNVVQNSYHSIRKLSVSVNTCHLVPSKQQQWIGQQKSFHFCSDN